MTRAGINFADTHTRTNSYVQKATLPLMPGGEVAGVVVQAPADAAVKVGQRVVALTGDGGLRRVRDRARGALLPDPRRPRRRRRGGAHDPGADRMAPLSHRRSRRRGRVAWSCTPRPEGVGSLAVQLGHPLGAGRVIATASSAERRELALSLGADVAIDPDPEGLTERLLEANGGSEVDVVFDMAGGETFERSYRALAHFGRIVVCGISSQQPNEIRTGSLLRHSRSVVGFYLFHCLERPGMVDRGAGRTVRACCPGRAARRRRRDIRARGCCASAYRPARAAHHRQAAARSLAVTGVAIGDATAQARATCARLANGGRRPASGHPRASAQST